MASSEDPAIQAYKPNPKGLLLTLARLGVAPNQAIYAGGRPEVDAEATWRAVIVSRARGFPEFRRRLEEGLLRRKQRFPAHAPPGVDRHPAQQ